MIETTISNRTTEAVVKEEIFPETIKEILDNKVLKDKILRTINSLRLKEIRTLLGFSLEIWTTQWTTIS